MDESTKELEKYWDEFSQEYEEIQNESLVNIGQELREFLLAEKLLPARDFLDLAGGTGKYIPHFSDFTDKYNIVDLSAKMLDFAQNKKADASKIAFIHQEQAEFLDQSEKDAYDFVFTAMNPALDSKEALIELNRISQRNVGILRLIFDEDNLFSQVEQLYFPAQEQHKEAQMLLYKAWLEELNWKYKSKKFRFFLSESISSQFFSDYLSDEISNDELEALKQLFFKENENRDMERLVIFELLYWEKC
ncbi:methyltransferase domain-containing protein [Lactococcus cremoris]|uniref:methyltransferase domain-containing protein n=1 Tax=Lactococcus lactis subsp. cremoris TaxID=1359 RepID=UPI0025A254BA|nr:class I SAM-dependent methyltransferase [Lactococcus cremoris]MDM7654141.1 methyltransferase domain-containing protein [Lactococcus cremoris]